MTVRGVIARGKRIVCSVCWGTGIWVDKNGKKWDCIGCGGSGVRDIE